MTRAVRAPGLDRAPPNGNANVNFRPGNGAGGVFAGFMQGATPKYAINAGPRGELWRNTMARMFIRVDASEMNTFLGSIGDSHTRRQLANRIAGDPSPQQPNRETGGGGSEDATVRRRSSVQSNGYLDFFMQSAQMQLAEKVQVSETLSDNYVAYTFGQSPPMWNFSGTLINSVQDDQASNMFRLYTQLLRATQMARRQKSLSLSFDSYVVNGVMTTLSLGLAAGNELMVPFTFQLLVKRVFVTNFTSGWVPTRASTPFAADLNAIAYDGRPREEGALVRIAARIPNGTSETTPTPQNQSDARTGLASGLDSGRTPPNFVSLNPAATGISVLDQSISELISARVPLSPLLPGGTSRARSEQASVLNYSRPETVNPPGVSLNASVSPGTPAPTARNLDLVMTVGSHSEVYDDAPGFIGPRATTRENAAQREALTPREEADRRANLGLAVRSDGSPASQEEQDDLTARHQRGRGMLSSGEPPNASIFEVQTRRGRQ